MKKGIIIAMLLIIALFVLSGCSGSSSSSSRSNGYSSTYNNNSSYRENVNSVANTFGEDPKHVDAVFNALSGH